MTGRDLADVVGDLADVHARLAAADDDDFATRADLRSRQEALRAEAAELRAAAPVSSLDEAQLRSRLDRLMTKRSLHLDAHIGASAAAQTGEGGGIDPAYVHELHRQMDEAVGLAEIEEEIRRLRNALAERYPG